MLNLNNLGEVVGSAEGKDWQKPDFKFNGLNVEVYGKKTKEVYTTIPIKERQEMY